MPESYQLEVLCKVPSRRKNGIKKHITRDLPKALQQRGEQLLAVSYLPPRRVDLVCGAAHRLDAQVFLRLRRWRVCARDFVIFFPVALSEFCVTVLPNNPKHYCLEASRKVQSKFQFSKSLAGKFLKAAASSQGTGNGPKKYATRRETP